MSRDNGFTEAWLADYQARQQKPTLDDIGENHGLTPRPSKYRNQKTAVDGITFDSKKEANRYCELKVMEKGGLISKLALQQSFELAPSVTIAGRKRPSLKYMADFCYYLNGLFVVEDVKGMKTDVYKLKRHLMKSVLDIDILET